jgi:phosphonate transport system substrate-binding protein
MNEYLPNEPGWPGAAGANRWWVVVCGFLVVASLVPLRAAAALVETNVPLHLGFSSDVFAGINENDARAALKIWVQTILSENGLFVSPEPRVIEGGDAMLRAVRDKTVDAVTVTTEEYIQLRAPMGATSAILGANAGRVSEEYLLLVPRDRNLRELKDLRGGSLVLLDSPRASLASVWFETRLLQSGLGETRQFCSRVIQKTKLSQVVLPVFFHQADACVVTRRGFQTMVELNPQVGRQLQTLMTSPPLVPVVFAFRTDYTNLIRAQIEARIRDVGATPAGQQFLTLFQCDKLEMARLSVLDDAFELLTTHARLVAAVNPGVSAPPGVLPSSSANGTVVSSETSTLSPAGKDKAQP